MGVHHIEGSEAPLVFYKGFTRSFMEGGQGTSADWISHISAAVEKVSVGKTVVVVDGVGFPGVGSCVGVSNAQVAAAARAPVLVVGKSGVGGAIDAYALNASFFQSAGVPVLGAVFNLGATSGFYHWKACEHSIRQYFSAQRPREDMFGVIPEFPPLVGTRENVPDMPLEQALALAEENITHVSAHLDVDQLLVSACCDTWNRKHLGNSFFANHHSSINPAAPSPPSPGSLLSQPASRPKRQAGNGHAQGLAGSLLKRSRAEVEAAAAAAGAKGG
uniref:Uncharacterized protein n=3 Tax=Rhizochromulina marina TaxID=1034831 RepID=A0A7S2WC98_9STRA